MKSLEIEILRLFTLENIKQNHLYVELLYILMCKLFLFSTE